MNLPLNKGYAKPLIYSACALLLCAGMLGCFQQIAETKEPLPDIIWPLPPDIPRIRFVNSISQPEDLNIRETVTGKFMRFLKGVERKSIITPYGITKDPAGRLFVVDTFHRLVHVFDTEKQVYYTFPDSTHTFVSPIGIASDNDGILYVSDSQQGIIRLFDDAGKEFMRDLGNGILQRPTGVAVNNETRELLVVDSKTSEVIRFDIESFEFKAKFGGKGNEPGMFNAPTNVFISNTGNIFVSDSLNFRIQVFTADGKFLKTFGQPGDRPGYFSRPRGVAVDSEGNIYVVDALFDAVQIFDGEGRLLMDFGAPGNSYGEFWLPSGMYIDRTDRIYISDSYNNRVQVFKYMKEEDL